MGEASEDDVPTVTSAAGGDSAADAEDRTIQEAPDADADADPTTAIARPPVPPPLRPRAPSAPEPPTTPKSLAAEDESEDSITTTAPRVSAPKLPIAAPKSVEIRTLDDDDENGEETELRTLVGAPKETLPNVASEAEAADDSVTAQAPVTRAPSSPEIPTATGTGAPSPGPIRISPKSLMPPPAPAKDAYDDDSVTSRAPAVDYADDSITTQAPNMPAAIASAGVALPPPIDGETEGTTKKVRKNAADEDAESITTQAPGHLTNMLRVIASDKNAPDGDDDDPDDPIQAHTQVMANAPLKPSDLGAHVVRGGVALAHQLEPSSESGLRVAQPERVDADRASLGAIGVPSRERRISNMAVIGARDSSRLKVTQPPATFVSPDADEKKPPYALVVGVVALISIAIPAVLFIVLNQSTGEVAPRVAAQPVPDPVIRADAPRARAPRPNASPSTTAPKRPPYGRR